jgi:L-amino acid N-acyltransferase YncA
MSTVTIRPATERDAAAVAGIYAPYVEQTAISIGLKFGRWHDVAWCQQTLRERPPAA